MALGPIEVAFLLFMIGAILGIAIPVVILMAIADNKGRSRHFAWWAVGLGWIGFIIAAVIMLVGSTREQSGR